MKLPKSFLAVNLSESHTFHKKEELEVEARDDVPGGETGAQPPASPLVNGSAGAALTAESNSASAVADTSI